MWSYSAQSRWPFSKAYSARSLSLCSLQNCLLKQLVDSGCVPESVPHLCLRAGIASLLKDDLRRATRNFALLFRTRRPTFTPQISSIVIHSALLSEWEIPDRVTREYSKLYVRNDGYEDVTCDGLAWRIGMSRFSIRSIFLNKSAWV